MTQPKLITKPFAGDALPSYVNEIPKENPTGAPEQNASWALGFPPITMTDIDDGGLPPNGEDMNGVLRAITEHNLFIGGGGVYEFTDDYISEVGGYSKGAVLISDDKTALWMSIQDNNTQNFNGATKNQWRLVVSADLGSTLASIQDALNTKADKSVTITAGDGLTGGGTLAGNRALAVNSSVVRTDRTITAGTGLSGGGNLSANRTLSVNYGTTAGTAAQGNDSRITGAAQKSANLSDLSSASAARQNLGLGSAATRDVGVDFGQVIVTGANTSAGLLSTYPAELTGIPSVSGFFVVGNTWIRSIAPYSTVLVMKRENSRSSNLVVKTNGASAIHAYTTVGGSTEEVVRVLYDDKNTTVGAGGALFAASPIIRLSSDSFIVENESEFGFVPSMERLGIGVYKISGTMGLRLSEFYIDIPQDRNKNPLINIDWEQDRELSTAVDGVISREDAEPVELIVRTYSRKWNSKTGFHENHEPSDIPEGREVVLRFYEIEQEQEDNEIF